MDLFLDALGDEIDMHAGEYSQEAFETIFFGGGTPSLLTPGQLERILSRLTSTFMIAPDAEVTVEANPGTVDFEKLQGYRTLGVNRLSIGVQSFHDDDLRFLTRIHTAETAKQCIRDARKAGFDNISVDLIFSLPHQSVERWRSNVEQALCLSPEHISAYSLIVEPNTPLARMVASRQVTPLPEDDDAALFEWTMRRLASAGFEHYEVSNYARPGYRSRHNCSYWNHTNYLGFGPSAHSFWQQPSERGEKARRWWNIANLNTYIELIANGSFPHAGAEELGTEELIEEEIMLGLRSDGIDLGRLSKHYSVDLVDDAARIVDEIVREGYAVIERDKLRMTDRGYLVCDSICQPVLSSLPIFREKILIGETNKEIQ